MSAMLLCLLWGMGPSSVMAAGSSDSDRPNGPFEIADLRGRLALAAKYTEAVSFCHKYHGRVLIKYAGRVLQDNQRRFFAEGGLYAAAIHDDTLIFNEQYNTSEDKRAGEHLLRDIKGLPAGTFVIVAAHYEASKRFNEPAQKALTAIGAKAGLQGQLGRTSYLCLGIVGLEPGLAIEQVGQQKLTHGGDLANQSRPLRPSPAEPKVEPIPEGVSHRRFEMTGHNYGKPIELWLYRPRDCDPKAEILFVIHGSGRNADDYLNTVRPLADRHRCLIVAPEFSPEFYPSGPQFHWGGLPRWGKDFWPFTLIELAFDYAKQCSGNQAATYKIIGHSAGGQFLHRFVMFCPDARFSLVIAGSAGIYCMPDFEVRFPHGLKYQDYVTRETLKTAFERRMIVSVGERDTAIDPNDGLNASQGRGHVARARRFVWTSSTLARELGADFNWKYHMVPKAGHNHVTMFQGVEELLFPR